MRFFGRAVVRGEVRQCFRSRVGLLITFFCLVPSSLSLGAEISDGREKYLHGDYRAVIKLAGDAIADREIVEEWRHLLVRSQLAVGEYTNALAVMETALDRYSRSIQLRLLAREVFLFNDDSSRAQLMLSEIEALAGMRRRGAYDDPANNVALGRAALLLGAEPRRILEGFFDPVKKSSPDFREVYLASGELALHKNDFALAAKMFREGLKKFPDDPDFHCGLAEAFAASDRRQMLTHINAALEQNTNHTRSYLLLADHLIDGEEYAAARKTLDQALQVNPWLPEAWAYRAVLEHLTGSEAGEAEARANGLKFWSKNPEVDHIVGKSLSQKYRFIEGSACQRRALRLDANYLPAKIQLAQDLLRLGEEAEGWQLAQQVYQDDAYDVTAFNLIALEETLAKFKTITNEHFVIRMSVSEADVYGQKVLALLERARQTLCAKYGLDLKVATTVEIFPEQKDFGVRTFGMPDNPGFLGVCFGPVITANSPASQGASPANWEAVLWHEFCHVVTLHLTRNKMPRWLSEGISVYEELQENPTWGQVMTPAYREMVLTDALTPVGELSAAFLAPKSNLHLQFAYYESSLVVEYLVQRFGLRSLQQILRDLGDGVKINEAIATHCAPLEEVEDEFEAFARRRAAELGPSLEWEKPEPDELVEIAPGEDAKDTDNYYELLHQANQFLRQEQWQRAKLALQKLVDLYPDQRGSENAYPMLALVHRRLDETDLERRVLNRWAALDGDAVDAFLRLMTLAEQAKDWKSVGLNARRFLAVNPLVPQPYRFLGRASEELNDAATAVASYESLLRLQTADPADTHFRLARLLAPNNSDAAKRHLLQSLEEAPRFADAHRLLLQMQDGTKTNAVVPVAR